MMRTLIRKTSILLCILTSISGYAQTKPLVVVSPMRGAQSKAAVQAITNELNQSNRVLVVQDREVQDFIDQYSAEEKPTSSKEAYEFFQQGKLAYQNLDMESAVDYFRKAERLYKNTLWDENSFTSFRTTKFQLSQSFLALGREQEARIQMEEVMLLDPERNEKKLSKKYYSPQVRKLYQEVFEDFQTKDVGDVVVQTEPAGAQVYFDGKRVGVTPTSVKNVPVGKHYFRLVARGFEEHVTEQFVVVGQNRVMVKLQEQQSKNVGQYFDTVANVSEMEERRIKFLDDVGLSVGGDIFLFLTPLSGKVRGQFFDQRSQELSPAIEAQSPKVLVASLLKFVGSDGYVVSRSNVPPKADKPIKEPQLGQNNSIDYTPPTKVKSSGTSITKKWWFWPAIGLVVVGAGAGLYFSGVFDTGTSSSTLVTEIP